MLGLELNKYVFRPLEVVGRGSETQLQVGENLNSGLIISLRISNDVTITGQNNQNSSLPKRRIYLQGHTYNLHIMCPADLRHNTGFSYKNITITINWQLLWYIKYIYFN